MPIKTVALASRKTCPVLLQANLIRGKNGPCDHSTKSCHCNALKSHSAYHRFHAVSIISLCIIVKLNKNMSDVCLTFWFKTFTYATHWQGISHPSRREHRQCCHLKSPGWRFQSRPFKRLFYHVLPNGRQENDSTWLTWFNLINSPTPTIRNKVFHHSRLISSIPWTLNHKASPLLRFLPSPNVARYPLCTIECS